MSANKLFQDLSPILYRLSDGVVGANDLIDFCPISQRISFMLSFSTVRLMPLPHRPLVQFLGMKKKSEYLIWREKNGFFAAMDKDSVIYLWSMPGGDLIDTKAVNLETQDYEIFQSAKDDDNYKRNYQDRIDRTVQLLKSKVKSTMKFNRSASM